MRIDQRRSVPDSQVKNAARLIDAGEPAAQVARNVGMSRSTLYRRLRDIQRADAAASTSS